MGKKGEPIDGVMVIDKPQGMGSNWALQITRRLINAQKAGHTGTLDPMATGILPLAFGNATKYSADLLNADKRYTATVRFGAATDTMDAMGTVTATSDRIPSRDEIEAVFGQFTGEVMQVPPMYSAIKHEGKNLYELARRGVEIEREPRKIHIYWLKLIDFAGDTAVIDARVSKGTYIRCLARDIASDLNSAGRLQTLKRTRVGNFNLSDAADEETLTAASLKPMTPDIAALCGMKSAVLRSKNSIKNSLKMLLLDLFNTVYTCCMTSACKLFLEESIDHTKGNTQADDTLTKSKDLCIVMLS